MTSNAQLSIELVARDLAHQILSRAAQDIDRIDREATQAQRSVGGLTGAFGGLGGIISRLGQAGFGVFGIQQLVYGVTQAAGPFIGLANAASALEEAQNRVNVVFGEGSDAVLAWAENSARALGQSETAAVQAVGTFGNLFTSLGQTGDAAATMSTRMVELAADFASFFDVAPEQALIALRAGLVGEIEPLRRFGIAINAAAVEAKALELGLAETKDEIEESDKVLARYQLILEGSTNAQGDFARTADSAANQQRILTAQMADLRTELGSRLLPAFTELLISINDDVFPGIDRLGSELGEAKDEAILLADALGVLSAIDAIRITVDMALPDGSSFLDFVQGVYEGPSGFVGGVPGAGRAAGLASRGPVSPYGLFQTGRDIVGAAGYISDQEQRRRRERELQELRPLITGIQVPTIEEIAALYGLDTAVIDDLKRAVELQRDAAIEQSQALEDLQGRIGLTGDAFDDWLLVIADVLRSTDDLSIAAGVLADNLRVQAGRDWTQEFIGAGLEGLAPELVAQERINDARIRAEQVANERNEERRSGRAGAAEREPTAFSGELQALIQTVVAATPTPAFGGLSPDQFVDEWEMASEQFDVIQRELNLRLAQLGLQMADLDAQGLENTDTFKGLEEQAGALRDALQRVDLIEDLRLEPFRDAVEAAARAVEEATQAEERRNQIFNQRAGVFAQGGPVGQGAGFSSYINQLLGIFEFGEFGPDPSAIESIRRLAPGLQTTVGIPGVGQFQASDFLEGGRFGGLSGEQIIKQLQSLIPEELRSISGTASDATSALDDFEAALDRIDLIGSLRMGELGEEAALAAGGIAQLISALQAAVSAAAAPRIAAPTASEQGA